ncbi:hypothetical protein [Streptomyces sp. NPDC059761]|uniref:hypothetical protein n=1 Tax=Streptomyces sp. NPDC059761 TaxID=3346937 RepID=UPI0036599183
MSQSNPRALDDFDPEEFELARRLFRNGHGVISISVRLARSREAIAHWVEGLEQGTLQRRVAEPWEIETARRMRMQGVSAHAIAREMHRSPGTVAYWVRDLPKPVQEGLPRYKRMKQEQHARRLARDKARAEKQIRALELYRAGGMSRGEIGREIGVGVTTVTQWVLAAGLELRTCDSWSSRRRSRP